MVTTRKWMDIHEVAEYLGLTERTVRKYRAVGRLPAYRIAGKKALRFRVEDVDALMELAEPTQQEGGDTETE